MNRIDKIKLALSKGYTCNPETGEVFGPKGNILNCIGSPGYKVFNLYENYNKLKKRYDKTYIIYHHHFIWYWKNEECVEYIDHKNGVRTDNKICNLRSVTSKQNNSNRLNVRVYHNTKSGKFQATIFNNYKKICLGTFNTEQEARQAYLDAKKIYHII